ncbi:hypothetical protein FJTKL_11768 [Diaporthe vaccinii]|uniref:Uncharacterized protein n=1 Tax=Diaporthe vaccinii TaxID=105482 RepID=A0ABR4EF63_9PEZI
MSSQPVIIPTASLHGKVALITGASRGIGRGCALELARRGCKVVINYAKSKQAADDAVNAIVDVTGSKDTAISIQADVTKVSEIERLFHEAADHFGRIDFVLSNSGAESFDKTEEISEAQYDYVFSLNTKAQFFVAKTAWKHLQDGGRVVLMSSLAAGALGIKDHALYNSSKLAVVGMVKAFATDFGSRRITVNGIAPGGVVSDMFYENAWRYIPGATADWPFETIENMVAKRTPLGRCGVPEDIARVVAFLMSEDGGWVNGKQSTSQTDMKWFQIINISPTGQVLTITGGYP